MKAFISWIVPLLLSLFMLYLYGVARYRNTLNRVFRAEMALCGFWLGSSLLLLLPLPGWLTWTVLGAIFLSLVPVSVLLICILRHCFDQPKRSADLALVLGMKLIGGQPNGDLVRRLDTALTAAQKSKYLRIIVSGGNGNETQPTESAVMTAWLCDHGLAAPRIIPEDKSQDTLQNMQNTAGLIPVDTPLYLITSNYHMFRALGLAQKTGYSQIEGLAAPSSPFLFPANVMWELVCCADHILHKQMKIE